MMENLQRKVKQIVFLNINKYIKNLNSSKRDLEIPIECTNVYIRNITSDVLFNLRQWSLACSSAFNLSFCLLYSILGLLIKSKINLHNY